MPPSKKSYPQAEAMFKGPEVPTLAEQATRDREEIAQAGRDKTARLRSERLARDAGPEAADSQWTVHYFDPRLNRDETSRAFASQEGAMHQACDLIRQGMRVDGVRGPENRRVGAAELVAWCKSHRTPERPKDPPKE